MDRGVVGFALWLAPHGRRAAEKHSHANSRVTWRIVDSDPDIETVKLFAHAEREQRFARSALARQGLRFGWLIRVFTLQQGAMATSNSAVMLAVIGPALWLWASGSPTIGPVSATIVMALRLNTMTVWII